MDFSLRLTLILISAINPYTYTIQKICPSLSFYYIFFKSISSLRAPFESSVMHYSVHCIREAQTNFICGDASFGDVNCRCFGSKFHFTATRQRIRKTQFAIIDRRFTSPYDNFQYTIPNCIALLHICIFRISFHRTQSKYVLQRKTRYQPKKSNVS